MSSEEDLQRFKDLLATQRKRILTDIEKETERKMNSNKDEESIMARRFDKNS